MEPFRLMDLPPELRNSIYRFAVVKKGYKYITLLSPALARVSRDVRAEVLPIFYGENSFYISMDIDGTGEGEEMLPGRVDDDSKLEEFLDMCSCVAANGGLKFIKNLRLIYTEPALRDMFSVALGFALEISFIGDRSERRESCNRIGDDNLDWSNGPAVTEAFNATLERSVHAKFITELKEDVPVPNVIRVLFALAQHCTRANQYVELSWDYGHSPLPPDVRFG